MADPVSLKLRPVRRFAGPAAKYQISPRLSGVLDCSRWVAAGLVVLYHIRINVLAEQGASTAHGVAYWLAWSVFRLGDCGPQAVLWFFVISGFLIGGKVADDVRRGRFEPMNYVIARISRLYVVLVPALLLGYGMDLVRVGAFGLSDGAGSETALSYGLPTLLANLLCLQTITAPTLGSNLPLWSLACEGWYYALFPLIALVLAPQRAWRQRIVPLLLLAASVVLLLHNPKILAYFMFWLLGVAVWFCPAPVTRVRPLAWLIAMAAMAAYPAVSERAKLLAMLLVALSFANVLLTEMYANPKAGRDAGLRHWNASLAGFSYSLYLTHAPLIHLVLTVFRGHADPRLDLQIFGWAPAAWAVGLLVLTYGYAWLFSRVTEIHLTSQVRTAMHRVVNRTYALL